MFGRLGVLLAGYAVLDGFDLGIGILHPFVKTEGALQQKIKHWIWTAFGIFLTLYILTAIVTLIRLPHVTRNFETMPAAWLAVVLNVLVIANIPRDLQRKSVLRFRHLVSKVWQVVKDNIPAGYSENIDAKFLTFKTGDEWYAALANKKNYISLHLTAMYVFPELKTKLDAGGKKMKGGKGCINFLKADELPLNVIGEIVSATKAEVYLAQIKKTRSQGKAGK